MENLVAKSDRAKTRKKRTKRIFTIPYEPIDVKALVDGEELAKIRAEAGFKTQADFSLSCGWSQAAQCKYERAGRNRIKLANIFKMIRVCNGSE